MMTLMTSVRHVLCSFCCGCVPHGSPSNALEIVFYNLHQILIILVCST